MRGTCGADLADVNDGRAVAQSANSTASRSDADGTGSGGADPKSDMHIVSLTGQPDRYSGCFRKLTKNAEVISLK